MNGQWLAINFKSIKEQHGRGRAGAFGSYAPDHMWPRQQQCADGVLDSAVAALHTPLQGGHRAAWGATRAAVAGRPTIPAVKRRHLCEPGRHWPLRAGLTWLCGWPTDPCTKCTPIALQKFSTTAAQNSVPLSDCSRAGRGICFHSMKSCAWQSVRQQQGEREVNTSAPRQHHPYSVHAEAHTSKAFSVAQHTARTTRYGSLVTSGNSHA